MPVMISTAADLYDDKPQEWHELPEYLREWTEAAFYARFAWELADKLQCNAHAGNRNNDHAAGRLAESMAYNAWQQIEMSYRDIWNAWILLQRIKHEMAEQHHMSEIHPDTPAGRDIPALARAVYGLMQANPTIRGIDLMAELDASDDEIDMALRLLRSQGARAPIR